jgi:hypothetical protein
LLEGGILCLRADGYDIVNDRELYVLICISLRWVEKPTAVPATMGNRIERAAFSKMADGKVREGI